MQKNRLVFIGSYSQPIVLGTGELVPGSGDGITVYRMDEAGHLTRLFAAGKPNPTYLALSPDKKVLYAVNELQEYHEEASGAVSAYAIDSVSGELTLLSRRMTGGSNACCVSVSADGAYVFVANFSGGSLAVFPALADGSLGTASCFLQHYGHGTNPTRQDAPHVHQVSVDPAGKHVLVADLGTDELSVYGVDWSQGCLIPNVAPAAKADPGEGPRQFIFDRSGKRLYLVTELLSTVRVYDYDAETGSLTFLQVLPALPEDCGVDSIAACIKLHPNGKFLYTSNRGHDSIALFHVLADGTLSPVAIQSAGGKTPRDFCLTPDGEFLLSGFQDSNELILYRIDPASGRLSEVERTPCNSSTAVLIADYE